MPAEQMTTREFLVARFGALGPGETIEIRPIHATSGRHHPRTFARSVDEALTAIGAIPEGFEVYYGVNPRRGREGTKEGVAWLTCLYADCDDKHFGGDPQASYDAIMAFELIPTGIVRSGHGWQPYWELEEWLPNAPANRDRIESMQRRLYLRLGGLDAVQDISRILRVPGTQNWKHPTEPLPVSVVHWSTRTYALARFEPLLPPLVGQEVTYRETQALLAEGERPDHDTVRTLLGYIDPRLPYAEYITVWGAVAYYYPDSDGLSLVDQWSSEARADAGQYSSPRTQPEKHAGFKRQTGRVATLGTLIHYAKLGGWRPPPVPLNAVTRGRRQQIEARLDELPNPTYDDLPHFLRAMYDHLGPLVEGLPRDLVTVVSLSALSILWPDIRFENLPLSLFVNLIMEQGSGKSKITTELRRVLKLVKGMDAIPFTSGSPQGMYTALSKSDSKRMYASFDEFGDFLATLKHDYMANARGVLNSLYDGQDVAYQLSRSSVVIDNPYVVVVATTTPRMFLDNVTPADLEGGFASRFWYVAPWWENKGQHDYPKEAARVALANALAEHVAAHAHITSIRFDCPEGTVPPEYAEYEALCGINTGERRGIKDALDHPKTPKGRYLARVKRVAGGLEMLDIRPRVHGNTVVVRRAYLLLAIILVRRCEAYADLILDLVAATEDEGSLKKLRRVLATKEGGASRADLLQLGHIRAQDLNRLLPILIENGECIELQAGGKTVYRLPGAGPLLRIVEAAD
jgi:hypothetical protein